MNTQDAFMKITAVYSDAGLIGASATPDCLGTYAWVHVAGEYTRENPNGRRVAHECGITRPFGDRHMENNVAELAALLRALRALPDGWSGDVYCDNKNALGWLRLIKKTDGLPWKQDGVPDELKRYIPKLRARLGRLRGIHLDGHPTDAHLEEGRGKRGNPVSIWNRWCDTHCWAARARHDLAVKSSSPYRLTAAQWVAVTPSTRQELVALGHPWPTIHGKPISLGYEGAEPLPVVDPMTAVSVDEALDENARFRPQEAVSDASGPVQVIPVMDSPEESPLRRFLPLVAAAQANVLPAPKEGEKIALSAFESTTDPGPFALQAWARIKRLHRAQRMLGWELWALQEDWPRCPLPTLPGRSLASRQGGVEIDLLCEESRLDFLLVHLETIGFSLESFADCLLDGNVLQ